MKKKRMKIIRYLQKNASVLYSKAVRKPKKVEDLCKTMKKLNFRTFKFQIVLLFLLMSVPAMGLALAASYTITQEAQKQIIDARQNNMKILVSQYDAGMESVINYIELLLFQDNSYVGLQFDESTTNFLRQEEQLLTSA